MNYKKIIAQCIAISSIYCMIAQAGDGHSKSKNDNSNDAAALLAAIKEQTDVLKDLVHVTTNTLNKVVTLCNHVNSSTHNLERDIARNFARIGAQQAQQNIPQPKEGHSQSSFMHPQYVYCDPNTGNTYYPVSYLPTQPSAAYPAHQQIYTVNQYPPASTYRSSIVAPIPVTAPQNSASILENPKQ